MLIRLWTGYECTLPFCHPPNVRGRKRVVWGLAGGWGGWGGTGEGGRKIIKIIGWSRTVWGRT